MLQSMTGFGAARRVQADQSYEMELRCVNNRYLKVSIKLPEVLQFAEPLIEKQIRAMLHRGTVTCAVKAVGSSRAAAEALNLEVLQSYVDQLGELHFDALAAKGMAPMLNLSSLVLLPGVMAAPEATEESRAAYGQFVEQLTQDALQALTAMRAEEGRVLAADLKSGCQAIRTELARVRERAPKIVDEYHERLKNKVALLMEKGGYELEEQGLLREVAVYADRCDVSEEMTRLAAHLDQYEALCDGSEERVGRKLDFLSQELLREANTIASKTNDVDIARAVVEIKSQVDRLKEQVQNVE